MSPELEETFSPTQQPLPKPIPWVLFAIAIVLQSSCRVFQVTLFVPAKEACPTKRKARLKNAIIIFFMLFFILFINCYYLFLHHIV